MMALRAVRFLAAIIPATLLAACAGVFGSDPAPRSTILNRQSPVVVRSCTEPTPLFEDFVARATSVAWAPGAAKQTSRLTIALSVENTQPLPAAMTNSGSGILYTLEFTVTNTAGKSFGPAEATGAFTGAFVHGMIAKGTPAVGTVAFAVPRGDYTLTISRKLSGQPPPVLPKNQPLTCKVMVSAPLRAVSKTLAIPP
jgi:hypothetical protein